MIVAIIVSIALFAIGILSCFFQHNILVMRQKLTFLILNILIISTLFPCIFVSLCNTFVNNKKHKTNLTDISVIESHQKKILSELNTFLDSKYPYNDMICLKHGGVFTNELLKYFTITDLLLENSSIENAFIITVPAKSYTFVYRSEFLGYVRFLLILSDINNYCDSYFVIDSNKQCTQSVVCDSSCSQYVKNISDENIHVLCVDLISNNVSSYVRKMYQFFKRTHPLLI